MADEMAYTASGKEVILKNDGTWESAPKEQIELTRIKDIIINGSEFNLKDVTVEGPITCYSKYGYIYPEKKTRGPRLDVLGKKEEFIEKPEKIFWYNCEAAECDYRQVRWARITGTIFPSGNKYGMLGKKFKFLGCK